jgi:ubiquinone/menaquinone biosynthesis C-methylase UbiE
VVTVAERSSRGDPNAAYALGHTPEESARLQRQADELAPESTIVLDRAGLGPGQSALDLGCGPRGVLDLLAARVGLDGRVVGVDADPAHVAMATAFAAGRGLGNVEVLQADATATGLSSGSFDVVHARTLLVTVPEPAEVAAEMARLVRPGGWVTSVEPDTEYVLCYPASPALDRLSSFFAPVFSRNGADPWIGRRVPELLRQAGLEDIDVQVTAQAYPAGHTRRTIRLDLLRSIRPQVIEMGLASGPQLDELDAAARAHLNDPATVAVHGLLFLTWGRKPG